MKRLCRRGHLLAKIRAHWQCPMCRRLKRNRIRIAQRIANAPPIACHCSCGTIIPSIHTGGGSRRYVKGHNTRERAGIYKNPNPSVRLSRERAMKKLRANPCYLNNMGGCSNRLHTHHIDTNPLNNADDNLMRLCVSHHLLVELGKINLTNPIMPRYYVDRSGKRRYDYPPQ